MTTNDGGAAFPVADLSKTQCPGLSIRDWFAGLAMQGFIAADLEQRSCEQAVAKLSYAQADALLAERTKGGE